MKVNIRTVAKHAGVSITTVSRVLNAPELVGEDTKSRVLATMKALNYQPSSVARSLSLKRSRTVGVIVPGIASQFFIELHKGIHTTASNAGIDLLLYDSKLATGNVIDGFYALKRRHIDGIIFSSGLLTQEYEMVIRRLGIPVVLVLTESANGGLPAFKVDDIHACFDAITYLFTRGHRNIAMISGPLHDPVAGKSRYDGYCLALGHYQIPVRDDYIAIAEDYYFNNGYRAMNEILARSPRPEFTAVFVAADEMALGVIRALHEAGIRVPEDVSVMGFDGVSIANMITPKLTTVAQPFFQMGELAVKALIDLIDDTKVQTSAGVHYVPHQVIGRESVTTVPIQNASMDRL